MQYSTSQPSEDFQSQSQQQSEFICSFQDCSKRFRFKSHFERHILVHLEEKQFKCDQCEKFFRRKDALEIHQRTHTMKEPHICEHLGCFQSFKTKAGLRYHRLKDHQKELNYICEDQNCKKAFLTLGQLKQHQRTQKHVILQNKIEKIESNIEILFGRDIFQFSPQDQKLIDLLWKNKFPQKNHELLLNNNIFDSLNLPHSQMLQKEIIVVVGLMDKMIKEDQQEIQQKVKTAVQIIHPKIKEDQESEIFQMEFLNDQNNKNNNSLNLNNTNQLTNSYENLFQNYQQRDEIFFQQSNDDNCFITEQIKNNENSSEIEIFNQYDNNPNNSNTQNILEQINCEGSIINNLGSNSYLRNSFDFSNNINNLENTQFNYTNKFNFDNQDDNSFLFFDRDKIAQNENQYFNQNFNLENSLYFQDL